MLRINHPPIDCVVQSVRSEEHSTVHQCNSPSTPTSQWAQLLYGLVNLLRSMCTDGNAAVTSVHYCE